MDSISNLSLLEIPAEDDSLLFDASAGGAGEAAASSAASTVFSCSPLLSLRSLPRPNSRVGDADSENASSAPQKDGANNKENVNWIKQEAAKLSMEPQQMKRKKKGGGYNLRKSLAWDRAFFTEEGVLNPLELSMISGTATPKRTNTELKAIQEEDPASASLTLQEIEENLFKQSSEGVVCTENRSNGAAFLSAKSGVSTRGRAPASLAKRKVLAVNDSLANRPKRNGCPRPGALSSPEPAKAPNKESIVTKIPGPKSNVSMVTTTAKSGTLSTGFSKRNQNAHPANNVQKYVGAKGLSKNPRTVPSKPKSDLAEKCSVSRTINKQAGKHLDSSVSEIPLSSGLHQPGTGAPKVSGACLPQVVLNAGEKNKQRQFQTTKSSGLRMPSPSLGFFSPAKPSGSHSKLQKSSKPCKPAESNFPKLRKLETHHINEARLPAAPRKRSEFVEGIVYNCTKKLSLPDVKSEPSMQVDSNQIAGLAVECDSLGLGKIRKQEMVEQIIERGDLKSKEQAELQESDNVSNMEDMEFHIHEKELLSKSHTHEQLEKKADHPLEDKLHDVLSYGNQLVVQEPQSIHHHSMHITSIEKDSISSTVHNAMGQDEEQIASNVRTSNESLVLQGKDGSSSKDSRHSGEFKEYNCVKTVVVNSGISNFSEIVLGGSTQGIPHKNIEQINDSAGDFVKQGEDAHAHLLNGNLLANCNDIAILGIVNRQLQEEQISTPNLGIVGEISSENENESQGNSCKLVHVTPVSSKHSPEKSMPEIGTFCKTEPKVAESEDCQHPVDDQSGFIQRRPVDEASHQVIDSKGMHNRTQAIELDRMCEDCIVVSATFCSSEVNNVSPESRPFCENNIENLHFAPQLCPTVKADCDFKGNDMLIKDNCTISEWQLRDDCSSMDTSMSSDDQCDVPGNFEQQASALSEWQLGDDGSSRHTSIHFDDHHDVPGNFEQHADARRYSEANKMIHEDENLVANHGHSLDENEVCDVTRDFVSNTKDSCGGSENPSCLLQHTVLAQSVREIDHTDRESVESQVEDVQAQSFVENPVVYNCNNEQGLSVTNDQLSLMGDNDINEKSHLSELQRPSVVGANSQHINNIMHLDGDELPANTAYSEEIKNNEQCLSVTNDQPSLVGDNDMNEKSHLSELQRPSVGGANSQHINIMPLDDDGLPANTAYHEEIKNKNLFEGALEGCNIYTSECNTSNHHTQAMPEYKDGNLDADERAECLQIGDVKNGSTDILPEVEVQLSHQVVSCEFDSSIKRSVNSTAEVVNCKSDEHCSSSENLELPASDNLPFQTRIPQGSEVSSQEAETNILEKDEFPNTNNMLHLTKGDLHLAEDSSKITYLEKSETKSKPEVPSVKLPPDVVPFSDEWLAAIEAAGEEILTMKSGAVQNSPPEKPQHEPGPWSPVRKNQAIGPFDCTKHINIPHSDSS